MGVRCPVCEKLMKSKGGLAGHFKKVHNINLKGRSVDAVVNVIKRNHGVYPFANMPEYIPSETMEKRPREEALYHKIPQDDSSQKILELQNEVGELRKLIIEQRAHRNDVIVIEPKVQEEVQRNVDAIEEEQLRRSLGLDRLKNEIEDIKRRYLQSHVASTHRDVKSIIDELENRRAESEEKISEANLTLPLPLSPPPLPPLPPPPFAESINDQIKRLRERALFR